MRFSITVLTAVFLCVPNACRQALAQSASSELDASYTAALGAYFDGRPHDAASSFRYALLLSSGAATRLKLLKELGALLTETGKPQDALAYWSQAGVIDPKDPFMPLQQGWNFLSLERFTKAHYFFNRVIGMTGSGEITADARFGLALTELGLSGPKRAIPMLNAIYNKNPYLLSTSALLLGENFKKIKKRQNAITYFKQALVHDPQNLKAEIELAELYRKLGLSLTAWQYYATLANIDPSEPMFESKAKKLLRHVKGNPRDLLYWTKIGWPMQKKPRKSPSSPVLSVALFSNSEGVPSAVKGFQFISTSDFSVIDEKLGTVTMGKANTQWSVSFNAENRIFELRDNKKNLEHSTRRSFIIKPQTPGASTVIKNVRFHSEKGVDLGDRELRGSLIMKPSACGEGLRLPNKSRDGRLPSGYCLTMINQLPMENYLPGVVSKASIRGAPLEAFKALAVMLRTKAVKKLSITTHGNKYDMCDSRHCLEYSGIRTEFPRATAAVDATTGEILYSGAVPADINFQHACGGLTEEGVNDGGNFPSGSLTPFELLVLTMRFPPDGILGAPARRTGWRHISWTALIDSKDVERRANRTYKIGKLKGIIPLKKTKMGRITSLRLEGTAGSAEITGFKDISYVLAAGTLRSTLFFIRALYKGRYPYRFILRGIGTGSGSGYCIAGGNGLARSGKKYRVILQHYFPQLKTRKLKSSRK